LGQVGIEKEDILQIIRIVLIETIEKFDPET
jgi:DNA-directed RNA polymerase specialized sigma subunit